MAHKYKKRKPTSGRKGQLYIHDYELRQPFKDDIVLLNEEKHEIHVDPKDAIQYINNTSQEMWDRVDRNLDMWFATHQVSR